MDTTTDTDGSSLTVIPTTSTTKSSPIDARFKFSIALLCIINLVCAIDATILSVALPTIATVLHGTAIEAFWAGTSFLLTSTIFVPTWMSLSHIIDRKSIILFAILIFTIGSIICSLATSFTSLLIGRSIQGIGGGGITALTNVIVSDMVSLKDRGKWWGYIGMMWCLGAVIGPLAGGAFAEHNWRWIFWLNLPFCGVGLIFIPIVLRLNRRSGKVLERMKEFDWIGSILFIGSLTSLLIPLSWGGVMYPWTHFRTLLPLMIGIMGLLIFFEYSHIYARYPLIRGSIFKSSTGTINFICTSIHGVILWSLLYYMPLYYAVAKDLSPIMSGVALFPFTMMMGPATVAVSIIIAITGRYRPSLWLGWTLTTLGTLLMLSFTPTTHLSTLIAIQLPSGLGFGILYPAISFAVQAPVSDFDIPLAAAMYTFFRTLGQTIGVAVSGNIFQTALRNKIQDSRVLSGLGEVDEWSRDASSLVGYVKSLTDGEVKTALVKAYCDALHQVVVVMCVLAALAMVATLVGTKGLSLNRELRTEQGWKWSGHVDVEGGKKDSVELESVSDAWSSRSLEGH